MIATPPDPYCRTINGRCKLEEETNVRPAQDGRDRRRISSSRNGDIWIPPSARSIPDAAEVMERLS